MASKTADIDQPMGSAPSPTPKPGSATIAVKVLRDAMKAMSAVVEARNTVPILSNILMAVGPSTMTLTATDLDLQLVRQLDLAEAGTGQAMVLTVCSGTLAAICAKLPADATMTLTEVTSTDVRGTSGGGAPGRLAITSGRARFSLPTLPATEFPVLRSEDLPVQFDIDRPALQQLLEAVAFAMSNEETRYYLRGIFLHVDEDREPGKLLAAATDGHRLAMMSVDLPDGAKELATLGAADSHGGVIVGRKSVGVLLKLLDEAETPRISIALSNGMLVAEMGLTTLTAKLVDGAYPDHRRVVPTVHERSLWVTPGDLVTAADRLLVVSSEKAHSLRLEISGDIIKASVRSAELGSGDEEVPATFEGEPLSIGFNGSYLIEILKHLTAAPVLIRMTDATGPALILDSEDAARRFVLMPVRI